MSGFAVVWNRDGSPVVQAAVRVIERELQYRGPDRTGLSVGKSSAMLHCALDTLPDSAGERQPVFDSNRNVRMVCDARIDNRAELIALIPARALAPAASDAEILLQAYVKWGSDLAQRVKGDFSFVAMDFQKQRLVAGRDRFGIKPLFWARTPSGVIFASTLKVVADYLGHPLSVSDQYLVELLSGSYGPQTATAFSDVHRVHPANTLTFGQSGPPRSTRYWGLEDFAADPLGINEASEALLDSFQVAVRRCLRSSTPVFAHASGGLDSSAVYATARTISGPAGPTVRAYANVFPGDSDADESPYIQAMDEYWGDVQMVNGVTASYPWEANAERFLDPMSSGDLPGLSRGFDLVRDSGSRVLLTGIMGDQTLIGRAIGLKDVLRTSGQSAMWRERHRFLGHGPQRRRRTTQLVRMLSAHHVRRSTLGRRILASRPGSGDFEHLSDGARALMHDTRTHNRPDIDGPWSESQRSRFYSLTEGHYRQVFDLIDRHAAAAGIECRHPFTDLDFATTAARVPEALYFVDGDGRGLHRELFEDILPSKVLLRTDKAESSGLYVRAMNSGWRPQPDPPVRLIERGLIDPGEWARIKAVFDANPRASGYLWPVWFTFSVERWLRMYDEYAGRA